MVPVESGSLGGYAEYGAAAGTVEGFGLGR